MKPDPSRPVSIRDAVPAVEVFAVYGVEPEVQAYAMAKYSRSALSMKESLKEITRQKAEKFLNTFYFQYGHRSIADLAHIALAYGASDNIVSPDLAMLLGRQPRSLSEFLEDHRLAFSS